jgi:hypothetical protein
MKLPGTQLSVNSTAAEVKISLPHLMLTNDGTSTIYLVIEQGEDYSYTPTADATTYFPLAAGESLILDGSSKFTAVHYVCDIGETSFLRYLAWR